MHLAQLRTASGIHCSDEARVPHTRRMSRLKRLRKYLRRARRRHDCLHIVRRIKKADQIDGYVVGVGKSWVLLSVEDSGSPAGFIALRLPDIRRICPDPSRR